MAEYCFFGQSHINIARSHNFVHFWYGFCAKGQGRHSLGSACFVYFIRTCQVCGCQGGRIDLSVPVTGGCHHNFFHSCYFCRNDIHKNRRGIGCFSSRYIYAHTGNGCYFLSQQYPVRPAVKPAVLFLFFVIGPDVVQRFFHHVQKFCICETIGFFNFFFCYPDIFRSKICAVKLFCICKQRFILFLTHLSNNLTDFCFILLIVVGTSL